MLLKYRPSSNERSSDVRRVFGGDGMLFLNHHRFRVEKRVAVGMYSGESNQPTVATTVRNICASKNREPGEAAVCRCPSGLPGRVGHSLGANRKFGRVGP